MSSSMDISHVRFDDLEPEWTLPLATEDGYRRAGLSPGVAATVASARFIRMPGGQTTPWHHTNSDHIITLLEGRVAFEFEDGRRHEMARGDLLAFPAAVSYRYTNLDQTELVLLSVQSRVEHWPPTTTYIDEPGRDG